MIRIGICEDERQQRQMLEEMVCRMADKLNLNREVYHFILFDAAHFIL